MAERITGQTDRQTDRSRFFISKDGIHLFTFNRILIKIDKLLPYRFCDRGIIILAYIVWFSRR